MQKRSRLPLIDAMKGIGCIAIIFHHLAFYGPMSEVVGLYAPSLIEVLIIYARQAVQIFFVIAGFLVAQQLAPEGRAQRNAPASMILRRYKRLITPFLYAIVLAALITSLVRPWFLHDSLSEAPTIFQLLSHSLLLHDLLGVQALSAGVWFVAIDFQLFGMTVMLSVLAYRINEKWFSAFPILIVLLATLSLWVVNRNNAYENYALYFFGAYGLGMLAYWSSRPFRGQQGLLVIATLGAIALALEFRIPIVIALASALLLSITSQTGWLKKWPNSGVMTWLGQRSYSIFLIHYGICIAFNAIWSRFFPTGLLMNTIGMLAAVLSSVGAGALLYRYVESQQNVIGCNAKTSLLIVAIAATFAIEHFSH
jgi:peptidoglycan/LPS O-acetylase OafA/YrhL